MDREAVAKMYGVSVEDINRVCYAVKQLHKRQPSSTMTLREYLELARSSGITLEQIGKRRGQFHLARCNDVGGYSVGNCRFVPQEVNQHERKEGYQKLPEFRALASRIAMNRKKQLCSGCNREFTPAMMKRWHGANCRSVLQGVA